MALAGSRGIGKTVMLGAFEQIAVEHRYQVISIQIAAGASTLIASLQAQAELEAAAGGFWSTPTSRCSPPPSSLPPSAVPHNISLRSARRCLLKRVRGRRDRDGTQQLRG